jgi:hypothetical protein
MSSALARFLSKNTVRGGDGLPLVHSASAYDIKRIIASGRVLPHPCDVFKGERLSYFFYGRPAYKRVLKAQISKFWELPSVLVFKYDVVNVKRAFPFDTGAFKRYPDFIRLMPREEFDLGVASDAPHKIVGAFFVNSERYMRLNPRDKRDFTSRFDVGVDDEEVQALQELFVTYSEKVDDRRATIELQSEDGLELRRGELLAVVFPEEYVESEKFMKSLRALGADPLPYASQPLRQEMYYSTIYTTIFEYYRKKKFVR